MEKFVIKRSEWYRGHGADVSALYVPYANQYCCLGLYGRDICDYSKEEMAYAAYPFDTEGSKYPKWMQTLRGTIQQIMDVNDKGTYTEQQREAKLTELFASKGIEVQFVD